MDNCEGCKALRDEYLNNDGVLELYWEQQMLWTAEHLKIRGWSGGYSAAERLYMDAHPPTWWTTGKEKARQLALLTTTEERQARMRAINTARQSRPKAS
jgi:hypothetical protein